MSKVEKKNMKGPVAKKSLQFYTTVMFLTFIIENNVNAGLQSFRKILQLNQSEV